MEAVESWEGERGAEAFDEEEASEEKLGYKVGLDQLGTADPIRLNALTASR